MCPGHRAADRRGMTSLTTTHSRVRPADPGPSSRPSLLRRGAIAVTGGIACLLPTVFAFNHVRFLVTGELSDHRFHQLTGQGLVLEALWLGGLLPMLAAGWQGRRPSSAAGLLHLAFVIAGIACSVAAPGGGAPILMGIIAVPGALVWLALPKRPRVWGLERRVDALLAPVALLTTAFYTPFVIEQIRLQNDAVGHHAQNPHFFDMAWVALTLAVVMALAAVLPAARRLAIPAGLASAVIGVGGLAFGEGAVWSSLALGLGVATLAAAFLRDRLTRG